jgi:hypothetical protein
VKDPCGQSFTGRPSPSASLPKGGSLVNEIWEIIWNGLPEGEQLDRDAAKTVSEYMIEKHRHMDLEKNGPQALVKHLYRYEVWNLERSK